MNISTKSDKDLDKLIVKEELADRPEMLAVPICFHVALLSFVLLLLIFVLSCENAVFGVAELVRPRAVAVESDKRFALFSAVPTTLGLSAISMVA